MGITELSIPKTHLKAGYGAENLDCDQFGLKKDGSKTSEKSRDFAKMPKQIEPKEPSSRWPQFSGFPQDCCRHF
jgi:hypothetical protein